MAEKKDNKGFGALENLSSNLEKKIEDKSPSPQKKKLGKKIKKLPTVKQKRANKKISIQKDSDTEPYLSTKELNYLFIAFLIILAFYLSAQDSKNSSNKQETSIGTTYNYSDKREDNYYRAPSAEAKNVVNQGWANMTKKTAVDNPDYQLAFELNLKGFNLGHPEGATNLGNLYEYGLGVPKDFNLALSWYKDAIKKGAYHSADAELGVIRTTLKLKEHLSKADIDELNEYVILAKKKTTEFNLWPQDNTKFITEANDLKNKIDSLATRDIKAEIKVSPLENNEIEAVPEEKEKPIINEPPPLAHGYVSLYTDRKTFGVFGWAAGYKNQDEANRAAYDICMKRGARNACEYLHGSYAKCIAIAESRKWIQSGVGNTKEEAEEQARSLCDKHGESCIIPQDGSGCSR
jgi:hypothetical protein